MKLIYMGTPEVSARVLKSLIGKQHEIIAVVTQPDRPKGRGLNLMPSPVKILALAQQIPVFQPESLKDPVFVEAMKSLEPDLILVVAFRILPLEILNIPKFGAINMHTSLLPKYRGAAPVAWALVKGEKETGVTLFQLDKEMDHGAVLAFEKTPIDPNENAEELLNRLITLGIGLIPKLLHDVSCGAIKKIEQNHQLSCPAPKLKKTDGEINWRDTAQNIHNKIRGLNPYPICTATMRAEEEIIRIHKSRVSTYTHMTPGEIVLTSRKELVVGCGEGSLELLIVQPPGKPKMTGLDFANGMRGKGPWQFL